MTITLTLDPETEQAIERKAARAGMTTSDYVRLLAERSARPRARSHGLKSPAAKSATRASQDIDAILERGDPAELKALGITPAKYPAKTGADLVRNLEAAGLLKGYGDPNIDSVELARQLREQAQTRDWS